MASWECGGQGLAGGMATEVLPLKVVFLYFISAAEVTLKHYCIPSLFLHPPLSLPRPLSLLSWCHSVLWGAANMVFGKVDPIPETPQGFLTALQTQPDPLQPYHSLLLKPPPTRGKVEEGRSQDLFPGDLDNVSLALKPQLAQN